MSFTPGSMTAPKNARTTVAALLACTVLTGLPGVAAAQEQQAPQQQGAGPDAVPAPAVQQGDIIRTIGVAGAQRLEPETIVSYIRLRPGDVYTAEAADRALVDLAATELFADFSIANRDGNVVITVVENPIINRVILEGNRRINDDKILPEINLAPRQIFTRSKVRADVARIIELYKRQGRYAATVEPQMVQLDQNRVDVVFQVTEGPRSRVRQINILGNEQFSDSQLRGEMVTKQTGGLLSFLRGNTSYDPDRLAFDQQRLRQFYLTEGYADFRVVSAVAELTPDRQDFIITYVVEEGERYRFGNVRVESQLRDFSDELLTNALRIRSGDWYNAQSVDNTIEMLSETAGTFGYAFADVRPQFTRNRETLTMDVSFTISEAPRVYVEAIEINGNTITQDKVIRREFRQAEGDAFNSLQVARSTARINSLGYFQENFDIEEVEGSAPDRIRLIANLEERPTGELSLSAGFSSLESFIFQGSIRQNNFRGRGQTAGLSLNYSRYSRAASISFTEPYLFDKNISAGIDIYRRDFNNGYFSRQTATYEQSTTGFSARVGIPLSEYFSLLGRYTLNLDDVTIDENQFFADFSGDGVRQCEPLLAGRYLCDAIGKRVSSILGTSLIYNTLDSRLRPTRGENISLSLDFAGLGGDTRYIRAVANARKFWNLGGGFIGSLGLEGGYIKGLGDSGDSTSSVLLTDRFFLGEGQMRGFDIRGVGPRVIRQFYTFDEDGNAELLPLDDRGNQDDALGGTAYYLARAEIEIPLGSGARSMGIRPSVFVDAGAVFGVRSPPLNVSPLPDGLFIPQRNTDGDPLFTQIDAAGPVGDVPCVPSQVSTVTNPVNPNPPACLANANNTPIGLQLPPFVENFYGNSARPRVSIGIGINWNSPFGPFRIDIARTLLKVEGDDTKVFSFNVGTQF